MKELLCLSQAIELARTRIEEPGFLRGRQRAPSFKKRLLVFAGEMIQRHGLAKYEHQFPLARMALQGVIGMPEYLIKPLIPVLIKMGLLERTSELIRRWTAKTSSPTSQPYWFCPHQYRLGADFEALLPAKIGLDFAASSLGSQSGQDETFYDSELEGKDFQESPESYVLSALTSSIDGDAEIDNVDVGLEDSLEDYRRTVVPSAMPDHRGLSRGSRADLERQRALDFLAQAKAAGGALKGLTLNFSKAIPDD